MALTESQTRIREALPGVRSALIIPGFFDNKPGVLGPHVEAASTISAAGIPTDVHVVGHHQGRDMDQNLKPVVKEMKSRAKRGPFVVFATSAGSVYPLLAATYELREDELEKLAGAVLMSPRVNSLASLESAGRLSPAYPSAVDLLESRWQAVPTDVQRKFAVTRHIGDTTVPWEASELAGARMHDSKDPRSHQDRISYQLTDGLPETVGLALAA